MNANRFTTKAVLVWFCVYITYYTDFAFRHEPVISQWTAVLLGSMLGIFGAVVGLYKKMRENDNGK